ncbi:NADH-quinone oxidoreductase subunit 1 [Aliiroseovarius sp. xm-m-379]|uniref:NAD(P)H-dependent oxidoreductase subunit E n=1 Tax=unclassified Aliiroseovarius TaxID=2623558 RepID=UPI001569BD70|nr:MULTISPECIES: NAD(P)H-dependent oxidoreductase subunit E [unclassified Aliiroseovarius]NRP12691.1 NADH-quinone oxidoreductase subunit 1 [Aliiroseovarius sp. xm-d-517]NRP24476.1 NADH-quinone oxidoreductase subunit 1 [Aliiroseovarius sp. xm-m-379]NRP29714.1 NADH-quinone oxidoreductase subunit 1 [Aliiroseovarius sp. xm-m-314]NRP33275.1 NADH-quinone oxidoreductase subunit 1 [Aliiroseovarius sp. xm-a-104]NRP39724.1 NADH-quinone oxidoreductase subunit 1 [Aliiroseovarius sp. xm-m-339-2]
MALDEKKGIWKNARGKGRKMPKGRQIDPVAWEEIQELLGDRPRRRDLLIEFLHLIQDQYGHLSAAHIRALAQEIGTGQAEIYEVASFYAHFDVVKEGETPPPALTIRVCDSLACELAGAEQLQKALEDGLKAEDVRVLRAPCMGRCDTAPVLELGHNHIDHATPEKVLAAIESGDIHAHIPNYQTLSAYQAEGGYAELAKLRTGGDWKDVQDKVLSAGLRGLGGAGFPSGTKWGFVRANEGPRYLAVNGDEGEPGTFKDRYYLERTPHLMLEGMLIAAWAVEAETCFIYMRDEYPAVLKIIANEIKALEDAGLVEPGYIELRRGAGAYICGEESAMIESIEGKRGEPRHRPPFVAQVGIFNRPTLVHNVETLLWVARILREGPEILTSVEKNGRKGLRSYSVSGRVKAPGVHLLPAGSTITDIIEAAGGMLDGHSFKAYQPGGPSSGLLPASMADIPLDFDMLQPHGSFIGSAAVVVLSDQDSARDAALNMLRFFEDESCGQCTPCRVGCEKAVKLMQAEKWDQALLEELSATMVDASICGLGQAAPNPIRLTMKHFPDEV